MANKEKMEVGEAVIEFYASFDLIKEYYDRRGYRKITLLHRELKKKLNWKMGYDTFRYHFNKEFKKVEPSLSLNREEKDLDNLNNKEIKPESSNEPIIASPNFSRVKSFNPNSD